MCVCFLEFTTIYQRRNYLYIHTFNLHHRLTQRLTLLQEGDTGDGGKKKKTTHTQLPFLKQTINITQHAQ